MTAIDKSPQIQEHRPKKGKRGSLSPQNKHRRQPPSSGKRHSRTPRSYSYWLNEDQIRWVEWAERRLLQKLPAPQEWIETSDGPRLRAGDYGFNRKDAAIWLAKERDKLPWPKIARQFFGSEENRHLLSARRAHARVDRNHPGTIAGGCRFRAPRALLPRYSLADRVLSFLNREGGGRARDVSNRALEKLSQRFLDEDRRTSHRLPKPIKLRASSLAQPSKRR
jgi:hypothetical protein